MDMKGNVALGINVIGNISANTGLGVHARHLVTLILNKGYPVKLFDIDPAGERGRHDTRFTEITVNQTDELPYSINLFVLQPSAVFAFLAANPEFASAPARLHAAVAMWELTVVPERWKRGFQSLDVVLAASDFVQGVFSANLSGPFIVPAPCPLYLPEAVAPDRARFGLPDKSIIFVTSFEPASDPERKNPFAAIRAFLKAFPKNGVASLVIKVNNAKLEGKLHPAVVQLHDLCREHEHIRIIDEILSYQNVLCLYASCDAFISLHRAEGLGLGLMEAMALGKPVIATAWSGNMSFMGHTNSCLVGYELVPVRSELPVYSRRYLGQTAHWADPSIEQAAAWMQELTRNAPLREDIGRNAANSMARYQAHAKEGCFLDELITLHQNRAFLPRLCQRPSPAELWQAASQNGTGCAGKMRTGIQTLWHTHIAWRLNKNPSR
jgi:glycosyltransferase involved in cell wall biosynthesis